MWTQQGPKLVPSGIVGLAQLMSVSLSWDGNTAIIGGDQDNNFTGAAWIWTRSAGIWSQQGEKLVGTGTVGYASQGRSVALSAAGNTAIVGGFTDDSSAGAAWVWTRSGGVWTQQGGKLVGGGAVGTESQPVEQGYSVSLSADGSTAFVGGKCDSQCTGATWVWKRTGGLWTQQGPKLVGVGAVGGPQQGYSIALSGDGTTGFVGGPGDNYGTSGATWAFAASAPIGATFYRLAPCRVLDTRNAAGPLGGPAIGGLQLRTFALAGVCNVPAGTIAVSGNVTVVNPTAAGDLLVYRADIAAPLASTVSFTLGRTRANNGILALSADVQQAVSILNKSAGSVHVIVDVNGYFK